MISVPSEAVVYYVTPTEPPNSDCPGDPCQTLDYYFSHGDRYFNSDKHSISMIFMHGNHRRLKNATVKDLETFEMIGMEPTYDVVVQFSNVIQLTNITTIYIGVLTLTKAGPYAILKLMLPVNNNSTSTEPRESLSSMNRETLVTVNAVSYTHLTLPTNREV